MICSFEDEDSNLNLLKVNDGGKKQQRKKVFLTLMNKPNQTNPLICCATWTNMTQATHLLFHVFHVTPPYFKFTTKGKYLTEHLYYFLNKVSLETHKEGHQNFLNSPFSPDMHCLPTEQHFSREGIVPHTWKIDCRIGIGPYIMQIQPIQTNSNKYYPSL